MSETSRISAEAGFGSPAEMLRALVEQAPIAIVAYDLDGRVTLWNPGAERVLGWPAAEALGGPPPHVPAAAMEEFRANQRAALEHGHVSGIVVVRRRRDGSTVVLDSATSALHDSSGATIGMMSMLRDVTGEHEARERLVHAEEQYRTLIEGMPLGAFLAPVDIDAPVLYIGPQYAQLLGVAPDAVPVTVEGFLRFVHPDDRRAVLAAKRNVRERAGAVEVEYRVQRRGGAWAWLQERIVRVDSEDGRPLGVQGFVVDVTERRIAEERSARDREQLQVVLDGVGEGIFSVDARGRVVLSNRAFHEVGGWSEDELQGLEARLLLSHRSAPGTLIAGGAFDCLAPAAAQGTHQLLLRHRDGRLVPVTCTVSPLRERSGASGVAVVVRDVSEVLALESQLRHAQRVEAIGRLAGGIAHDFNNLLTVIQGHLALAFHRLGEDADLHQVQRAAERAAGLTQQLLAYGRRQVLQPVPTDINAVVEEMQAMLGRLLGADIEVVLDREPGLPATLVDAGQLEQVIVNLAVNARDAMPAGGRLTFSTRLLPAGSDGLPRALEEPGRAWVLLSVADTGTGIEPSLFDLIFEPFFTTKESGHGSGLGLSTVYGIVTQSGGDVRVRNLPGAGAEFSILLPVTDVPAGRPGPAQAQQPPAAAAGEASAPGGGETLLLVEDETAVRELLVRALQAAGYHVLQAGTAAEALLLAEVQAVDLLVTDIVLPGARGTDVLAGIRAAAPATPAVLISGYSESALADGVPPGCTFLQKPFTPDQLAAAVRALLGRRAAAGPEMARAGTPPVP